MFVLIPSLIKDGNISSLIKDRSETEILSQISDKMKFVSNLKTRIPSLLKDRFNYVFDQRWNNSVFD